VTLETKLLKLFVFVLFVTAISNPEVRSAESSPKKVTVGYTSFAPSQMWFLLERELGYFAREQLRPEFVQVRGGGVIAKGLIAGNFDYMTPMTPVLEAFVRARQPLKIILVTQMLHLWLVAQPQIRSIADLKGKTVGIGSLEGGSGLTLREILRQGGLNSREVTFVVIGSSSDRFIALSTGRVHSAFMSPPYNLKAVELGYRKLASAGDYIKWPQTGLAIREEKIFRDPEEALKMVRASYKGLKFILTQREHVISKMMQMFKLSRDEASKSYDTGRDELIPAGFLSDEAQRQVISLAKQDANVTEDIPPDRVFENRFLKQVESELKDWTPGAPK
jgi:NitT/TauT family transport system substrate-binding protein